MVDCCELSLGSSLFSDVSRMSYLLDLPLPCGWEMWYNDLKPTPLGDNEPSRERTDSVKPHEGSTGQQYWNRAVLSSKHGGEGRAVFVEPILLEISGDEQQGARRSLAGRRRKPPLVYQGEMLYRHRRDFRWWKREGSLIVELSLNPDVMLWRRRFQGAATAAVDYVQQC